MIEKILEIPANKFIDTVISTVLIIFNKNKKNTDIEFVDENGKSKVITQNKIINENYNLSINNYVYEEEYIRTEEEDETYITLLRDSTHKLTKYNRFTLNLFDKLEKEIFIEEKEIDEIDEIDELEMQQKKLKEQYKKAEEKLDEYVSYLKAKGDKRV